MTFHYYQPDLSNIGIGLGQRERDQEQGAPSEIKPLVPPGDDDDEEIDAAATTPLQIERKRFHAFQERVARILGSEQVTHLLAQVNGQSESPVLPSSNHHNVTNVDCESLLPTGESTMDCNTADPMDCDKDSESEENEDARWLGLELIGAL